MTAISFLGFLGIISGIFQILFPDIVLKLKPLGVKTRDAIKLGGYMAVIVGILFVLFDIFLLKK